MMFQWKLVNIVHINHLRYFKNAYIFSKWKHYETGTIYACLDTGPKSDASQPRQCIKSKQSLIPNFKTFW